MCSTAILRLVIRDRATDGLPGLLRNKDTKATRKAKALIALAQRDYRMARRPHGQTAALQHWADEQDRPSELAVVIPRSHRQTGPCSHIHNPQTPTLESQMAGRKKYDAWVTCA